MGIKSFFSQVPFIGGFFNHPVVPVIRFSGVLTDSPRRSALSYDRYRKIIDKAFLMPNLKAVAIVLNCPGGTPAQAELIATYIRKKADEKNVSVLAFVEDVAASGGYWLACAADEIYAARSSITGSIGVVSASFGFEDFIAKHDIKRRLYTQGKEKSLLDPFLPEKESDVKRLKTLQKNLHQDFIDWVQSRRGEKLKGNKSNLFEGQIWLSPDALEKGIIDDIGSCDKILEDKFGENVARIDLSAGKKLFAFPSFLSTDKEIRDHDFLEQFISTLEDKAVWSRYGL